jgi:hypothetical protein
VILSGIPLHTYINIVPCRRRTLQELLVGFEALTEATLKPTVLWELMPCSPALVPCLAYSSTLKIESYVPPKRRLTHIGLHNVISRKNTEFLMSYLFLETAEIIFLKRLIVLQVVCYVFALIM